jgi:hypothetical protein
MENLLKEKAMRKMLIRKRPCGICRRWFMPNPRLKDRQKTCGTSQCKREWHRKMCRKWNRENADYFTTNYLQKKLEAATGCSESSIFFSFQIPPTCCINDLLQHFLILFFSAFYDITFLNIRINAKRPTSGQLSSLLLIEKFKFFCKQNSFFSLYTYRDISGCSQKLFSFIEPIGEEIA